MFRGKKEYEILNEMLDAAINGDFKEEYFDENELSKFQTKFKRYLQMSAMSKQNIDEQKKRLQELITNISHQTKTPLTSIRLYSDLLQEQVSDDRLKVCVEEVHKNTEKLEQLPQALVKMSRLETGVFQYNSHINNVFQLAKDVVRFAERGAKEKRIEVVNEIDDDVFAVFDMKWTAEAVGNILDNALKYSNDGSKIKLTAFDYEMFAGISISDQGVGIQEEDIPKIFGRFERGRKVSDVEGIGVGLYLARQIIEDQGGYIKVSSIVGKGSTFSVYLPKN